MKSNAKTNRIEMIAIKALVPTPDNTRNVRPGDRAVSSLAESIRQHGILQPLIARPHPDRSDMYDLRAGTRRLLAASAAGLDEVPVIVRELSDREAVEVTVTENLQREDLTPLEESRGIQAMVAAGWEIPSIASRLGKSTSWVARRSRLSQLLPEIVELIEKDGHPLARTPVGVLEELARLPVDVQRVIAADLKGPHRFVIELACADSGEFRRYVNGNFLRRLSRAPWRLDDGELEPKAGPCSACMKRSKAQPLLFGAEDDERIYTHDQCLDAACFARKTELYLAAKIAELKREHKDLLLVDRSGSYTERLALEKKLGARIVPDYEVCITKASEPGTRKALVVRGPKAGKIITVKAYGRAAGPAKGAVDAQGRPVAKPLKQRRAELSRRREAFAVDAVKGAIKTLLDGEKWASFKVDRQDQLLQLVAVFGLDPYVFDDPDFDKIGKLKRVQIEDRLTRGVCGVWLDVLTLRKWMRESDDQWRFDAASAICPYLGLTWEKLLRDAESALPEPKSWARLKADGTPKTVAGGGKRSKKRKG